MSVYKNCIDGEEMMTILGIWEKNLPEDEAKCRAKETEVESRWFEFLNPTGQMCLLIFYFCEPIKSIFVLAGLS